jgi:poly(3-hydroxybutyrate) depolymerase
VRTGFYNNGIDDKFNRVMWHLIRLEHENAQRMARSFFIALILLAAGTGRDPACAQVDATRPIWFGTTLDPQAVMTASQQLAKSIANPGSPQWQAKGDQKRTYRFPDANADEPYRVCVPGNWDGKSKLPLVMFLHGAGNTESSYLDQNNKQMVTLAGQHGFLLVSPMGDKGAYGTFLRLTAPFGDSVAAAKLMAQVTTTSERTNELSEMDVINVLELVLNEYPIDRTSMFLTGHSMGSGGTWYIGGKYPGYWKALAPMSGPFVQESGYPWDSVRKMSVFITEGTLAPSLSASRVLRDWMNKQGFNLKYKEVNADHPGMVPLVLPDVFSFFDSCRKNSVAIAAKPAAVFTRNTEFSATCLSPQSLRMTFPLQLRSSNSIVSIFDIVGRTHYSGAFSTTAGEASVNGIMLPAGAYRAEIRTDARNMCAAFMVVR